MLVCKSILSEFKVAADGKRETVGVLSTSDVDRQGDIVDQKSLGKALETFIKRSGVVTWNHDWQDGIGRLLEFESTKEKTLVRIQYGKDYMLSSGVNVNDKWAQIEQGIARNHSHAFTCKRNPIAGQTAFECFVDDVMELAVVIVPANAGSTMDAVKRYLASYGTTPTATMPSDNFYQGTTPSGVSEAASLVAMIEDTRRALRGER